MKAFPYFPRLLFSMLGRNFNGQKFFLAFLENRFLHFMQIVSTGDNLHEMSKPVFWENKTNIIRLPYFFLISREIFRQLYKGDNFRVFLLASHTKTSFRKRALYYNKKNMLPKTPFQKGDQTILYRVASRGCVSISLKCQHDACKFLYLDDHKRSVY